MASEGAIATIGFDYTSVSDAVETMYGRVHVVSLRTSAIAYLKLESTYLR